MRRSITFNILLIMSLNLSATPAQDQQLIEAVQFEDLPLVSALLGQGADPNAAERRISVLGWAVRSGNAELVNSLLDAGADPNTQDFTGDHALAAAVRFGFTQLIAPLVDAGSDPTHIDKSGNSLGVIAILEREPDVLKALADAGVDLNIPNEAGDTPAMLAVQGWTDDLDSTLPVLAAAGADLDRPNRYHTPLTYAAEQSDEAAVEALLQAGADPNVAVDGRYPLSYGAGTSAIVKRLLLAGANPSVKNQYGEPALFSAIDYGDAHLVQALIDAGADANQPSDDGQTALDRAQSQGKSDIEEVLLAAGASDGSPPVEEPTPAVRSLASQPTGELAELPKLAMLTGMGGTAGNVTYSSSASLAELQAFYTSTLTSRNWQVGDETTDGATYLNASYARGDESLSLTLSKDNSGETPLVRVGLTAHGDQKPKDLPRVAGAEVLYEGDATAIYVSDESVGAVMADTLSLLRSAGWEGNAVADTETMKLLKMTLNGVQLTAQISVAAGQNNRTAVQYSLIKSP